MKKDTDQLLTELPRVLPPAVTMSQVAAWVKRGRARRRFYPLLWLGRVWRWHNN